MDNLKNLVYKVERDIDNYIHNCGEKTPRLKCGSFKESQALNSQKALIVQRPNGFLNSNFEILEFLAKREFGTVLKADSLEKAVEVLVKNDIQLLILDIDDEKMGGFEFLRAIDKIIFEFSELRERHQVQVICLTNRTHLKTRKFRNISVLGKMNFKEKIESVNALLKFARRRSSRLSRGPIALRSVDIA